MFSKPTIVKLLINKKVLLFEHKRRTVCRIASTHSAALSQGEGASSPNGGTPIQSQMGTLQSSPDERYPYPVAKGPGWSTPLETGWVCPIGTGWSIPCWDFTG